MMPVVPTPEEPRLPVPGSAATPPVSAGKALLGWSLLWAVIGFLLNPDALGRGVPWGVPWWVPHVATLTVTAVGVVVGCGVCWLVAVGRRRWWLWLALGPPSGALIGAVAWGIHSWLWGVHPQGPIAMAELGAEYGLWSGLLVGGIMAWGSHRRPRSFF
jgi:hypothetical protein